MPFSDSAISISNNNLTDLAKDGRLLSIIISKIVNRCFPYAGKKSFKYALNKTGATEPPKLRL